MRLIDASSLKLVSKRDDELPPYAILSHTWGSDEDEVSFEEMQSFSTSFRKATLFTHPVARKTGFAKIQQSARLALSQGLQYVWIDTCCINKNSSAELSEAINSMFRWYQSSAVCYAFLSDVSVTADEAGRVIAWQGKSIPHRDRYSQTIYTSRWFTRGWTLQELVAPSIVDFYAQDWTLLGGKNDWLQDVISNITGIPETVLDGSRSLQSLGIAERMHWASWRVTTRVEDQAYCLMGIFDINMPLLYGEGSKAFIRLQEEILKASNDHSLFAWKAQDVTTDSTKSSSSLTGLLAPSPACFRHTGHIVPLPPDDLSASEPWTMTNIGLQINLELAPVPNAGSGDINAVLDCVFHADGGSSISQGGRAAIRLTDLGQNQYARARSHSIFKIHVPDSSRPSSDRRKQIYVKQQPVSLTPDILLYGLETIQAHNGRLISVWPHEQWDVKARTVRAQGASRAGIMAAFRFKFDVQATTLSTLKSVSDSLSDPRTLDIFVGTSLAIGTSAYATGSAWFIPCPSNGELPLPKMVASGLSMPQSGRHTSYIHNVELLSPFLFNVKREGQSVLALSVTMIHELPMPLMDLVPLREIDPAVTNYEHLTQRLTVEDAASYSLTGLYSSIYEIRIGRHDGSSSCREQLNRIRQSVQFTIPNIIVLNPDQTTLNRFEAYFSSHLVQACIQDDLGGVRELLKGQLSTSIADIWTSEVHTDVENFDMLNILRGFRPLHWAALLGYTDLASILLENGSDPFSKTWAGLTPIHVAMVVGHVKVLERIMAANISQKHSAVNKMVTCDTLHNFAASFISTEKVIPILRWLDDLYDPDALADYFNVLGENFVHRAAAMNNIHAAKWAATWQGGRLLNGRDKRGRTPLFHAAAAGSVEVCQILLENNADANIADELGRTPLSVACWHNHRDTVETLLKSVSSPEPTGRSIDPRTPEFDAWHFAALSDDVDLLNLLSAYRPYVEDPRKAAEKNDGEEHTTMTPLHIASSLGLMESVMFLAHETQNFTAKTKFAFVPETVGNLKPRIETSEPRTAEEWARARGFEKVAAFLQAVSGNTHRQVTASSPLSGSSDGR